MEHKAKLFLLKAEGEFFWILLYARQIMKASE